MKTENMTWQVLDAIKESYFDDKELLSSCLRYLYYSTEDDTMRKQIVDILNDIGYCLTCGCKMTYYEWTEPRPICQEAMSAYDCPNCNRRED